MGVRWNEQLNSWIVTPEEGKKFETKNVLKTLPHRDWVKSAGETISGAATALGEAERVRTEAKREISDAALATLGKGMSFAGQEYLLGLPPGGKYGPWIREGLTKQEYEERNKGIRVKLGLPLPNADQDKAQTNNAKVNPADAEQDKISNLSSIQNIPTGFKTQFGTKQTKSYTPDQMKEWEEKGGDMTPDDYFSRRDRPSDVDASGKLKSHLTGENALDAWTSDKAADGGEDKGDLWGKEGTMTKNLQIATAVLKGLQKLQPQQEKVDINWSNPYDEDNIRGYTGTWA
tara:strand:+ start:42 stop:908 length:867 start_codon:yes stop_codon:yes gene_type:complete